ncbi:prohibitin-1 mitochondrial [Phtheirospermum japonicum]|uniref:Prohibitin-1 mitochondrial n=1 Tax=Phtheirospermum japonicum TaxID=374723 RepID=A0A830C6K7_9LAMI|nr:prohibitin-1 mitochondrial [Phtheirospermum japonicum]
MRLTLRACSRLGLLEQLFTGLSSKLTTTLKEATELLSLIVSLEQKTSQDFHNLLTEQAVLFHLAVDDVSITKLSFWKECTCAIEAKLGEAKCALLIGQAAQAIGTITSHSSHFQRLMLRKIFMSESKNRMILNSDELVAECSKSVSLKARIVV